MDTVKFNNEQRQRLSGPAKSAVAQIMQAWQADDEEAARLQGGAYSKAQLSDEQLTRAGHLINIYTSLHTLYGPDLADAWMRLANSNQLFKGAAPIAWVRGERDLEHLRRVLNGHIQGG